MSNEILIITSFKSLEESMAAYGNLAIKHPNYDRYGDEMLCAL